MFVLTYGSDTRSVMLS